jgi:hypothetical protein
MDRNVSFTGHIVVTVGMAFAMLGFVICEGVVV